MKFGLLSLHAQSSIHAGAGSADSVIDLPVQREAHTNFPCVFGSSVKGALRANAESKQCEATDILFGKEGGNDQGNAGSLLISDARLLLLPVRSLTGQFKWVTSPAVLARWQADAKRFGIALEFDIPLEIPTETLIVSNKGAKNSTIYLEEYAFKTQSADLHALIEQLAKTLDYTNAQQLLENQLVIVGNDDFAYLASYTLPVNPHITIETATKTAKAGALWYEETLPPDSVLYVGVAADQARVRNTPVTAEKNWESFAGLFAEHSWLQIGGNETVGMGWCYVNIHTA
ncbi:type III-B CRISPR module RAMP protein Cmr4 [Pelistega sp. MC2]|uniref:type III-B CRISPR module RAMP protein Cmr4 n=1 Tax=Pelistega sp. MC2 TaxID=1720297 RepID=UPI0008DAE414|nr:type III-B CRISPR module RAMP protein Cmr4 [Pelistega sp. MC2]